MTIDMKDFLSGITDILHRIDYIKPEDPRILIYIWIRSLRLWIPS